MKTVTSQELLNSFDLFLIDAYGVLVDSTTSLPGAEEFLREIEKRGKEFYIVTNDASRTPETCARVYRDRGVAIPVEKILSAGMAIAIAFEKAKLKKPRCAVLGTKESRKCVERAGGIIVDIDDVTGGEVEDFDVLVIADDSGFDFLPTMNALLNALLKMTKSGQKPKLLLANPDRLYPRPKNEFGFASGSVAKFLEIGLKELMPDEDFEFEILGKPAALLFDLALSKSQVPHSRAVMLGDQLRTDVAGAKRAGISAALLTTGITKLPLSSKLTTDEKPDFILNSLT